MNPASEICFLPGYDEKRVFSELFSCISSILPTTKSFSLRLRLHPKEQPDKYQDLLAKHSYVQLDDSPLSESLSRAKYVFGIHSMVLFQAAFAGKRVFSYMPVSNPEKDCLRTNQLGLSTVVYDPCKLLPALHSFFSSKVSSSFRHQTIIDSYVSADATERVFSLLETISQ